MTSAGIPEFDAAVAQMPELLQQLRDAPGHRVAEHPTVPAAPGIYLFNEGERPVYVGQSRNLRKRLKQHTGSRRDHNQASFAFNLAKREAATAGADVTRFRAQLSADPAFAALFTTARETVAAMSVRFIEVPDRIVRTLFEVYAALALDTVEFNSFETH